MAGKTATAAAKKLLAELRKSFLDHRDPDPDKVEAARDAVLEEPSIVYALTALIDDEERLTLEQRSVIGSFGADVAVNHTDDKKLFDAALGLVVDLLLNASANAERIEKGSLVHVQVAEALALINGDLDLADGYQTSLKKLQKALAEFRAEAEQEND